MARARTGRPDGGQAVPIAVAFVAIIAIAALALADLGRAAVERSQARTAADAAALAGAAAPPGVAEREARSIAEANGAALIGFDRRGMEATVHVRLGRATATARARREIATGCDLHSPRCPWITQG
jgi:hypothetical protein